MADGGKKLGLAVAVTGAVLALDQWSKNWARRALDWRNGGHTRTVVQNYFDLRYSENTGSAFGLFQNAHLARWGLVGIGILALIVIPIFIARTSWAQKRQLAALALVAGGTIGNVLDRIRAGRVSDFIVWKIKAHEWPAFNVADASLVCGVLLLAFDFFPEKSAAKSGDKSTASKVGSADKAPADGNSSAT